MKKIKYFLSVILFGISFYLGLHIIHSLTQPELGKYTQWTMAGYSFNDHFKVYEEMEKRPTILETDIAVIGSTITTQVIVSSNTYRNIIIQNPGSYNIYYSSSADAVFTRTYGGYIPKGDGSFSYEGQYNLYAIADFNASSITIRVTKEK